MSLPPWRTPLSRAIHRNRSLPASRYVQLATIENQRPKNRTVVFRGFVEPASQLQFVTDRRSPKIQQITDNPWAEVCWYFSKTREQFRIAGQLQIVDTSCQNYQILRHQAWYQLSSSSQEQFSWPQPADLRTNDAPTDSVTPPEPEQPSTNFCLLLLAPTTIDHLELRGAPQNRWQYIWDGQWSLRPINP